MLSSRSRRLLTAMAVAAGVALVPVTTSAQAATTSITACVKTRTGAVKVLPVKKVKSKCPKGWKKFTWNLTGKAGKDGATGATGATGPTGPAGPQLNVKGTDGGVVGQFVGYYFTGSVPLLQVQYQGGLYIYYPSGQLVPLSSLGGGASTVNFKTADCSGTGYFQGGSIPPALLASFVGSAWRFVNRPITPPFTFGPATAWKLTTTTENIAVATQLKKRDTGGACVNDGAPFTGTLITLAETPAPPDGVGPLTIG